MHVEDVVEAIYSALCRQRQAAGPGPDPGMTLGELHVACGCTRAEFLDALYLLDLDLKAGSALRLRFVTATRVTLGSAWADRCAAEEA